MHVFVYICVYTHVYVYPYTETHRMECYANIKKKKKKFCHFATKHMNFESVMLGKINQRKTNTVWSHLYGEYKKNWTHKERVDWSLPGVRM